MWKSRRPVPVWAWSLLSVSLVFAVCVGVFGVGAVALARPSVYRTFTASTPAKRVYTREEFRELVEGKSEAGVLEAVGRPDDTSDLGSVRFWHYHRTTRDTITGKIDSIAQVEFRRNVASVNY